MSERVDVSTLTDEEIRQAIINDGIRWGSHAYYIKDQIDAALRDKAGIVAYRETTGPRGDGQLRAYYKTPDQRRRDAEAAAWKPGMPPVRG